MASECNLGEAKLYYLFMMSDGEVSYSEEKLFESICQKLDINKSEMEAIAYNCKKMADENSNVFNIIKKTGVVDQAVKDLSLERDIDSLARVVWNLVNLGYADAVYSDKEKEIVKYLVNKWKLNAVVYMEMVDIADTMLSLTKQKEWVLSTIPKGKKRDIREKEIDESIKMLLEDVEITIKELSM